MSNQPIKEIAQRAILARKEGRTSDGCRDGVQAAAKCREVGDREMLVHVLKMQGQFERDRNDRKKAIAYYSEAVDLCRDLKDSLGLAHAIRHVADLHCEESDLDRAELCYAEALSIYRTESGVMSGDLANAVRGYAVLKDSAGAHDKARSLWEEACNLYQSLGVEEGVAECKARLSA